MKLIFIYGPPAAGKLTVANEIAAITGYKVFHNHMSIDLAESIFKFGTKEFTSVVEAIRMAVFEAAASSNLDGLIFTLVYAYPDDTDYVKSIVDLVEKHGGEVCFAQLTCSNEALEKRVTSEDRTCHTKIRTVETLHKLCAKWDMLTPVPFYKSLSIDNTELLPKEAALEIVSHYHLPTLLIS